MQALNDTQLRAKTDEFRQRLENGESLDDILIEAFAVVRETGCRVIGRDRARHFDSQMMGGIVLHQGRIAEMKTGEGKTLTATLPLYLNALEGRGAHLVTVNDYLSRRDARWYGPIYHFLGLSVGAIRGASAETGELGGSYMYDPEYVADGPDEWDGLRPVSRHDAYMCDITCGTNNEFGFDYLRDNMAPSLEHLTQRELRYAIVDEVDSILIDEARTPLIISGIAQQATDIYYTMDRLIRRLSIERHYTVDEKAKTAMLTEEGTRYLEELLNCGNLADPENFELMSHANSALKAHAVFKRDVDYVVKDGQVIIVDEFTGRLMFGRRWSDGQHQAVEAKENCNIEHESQTLATITFQNYFRIYDKLAGMTGTAKTEENEFRKIYGLDVVQVPTNKPMIRTDHPDVVYKTEEAKMRGITAEILACHARRQPVLVGTRSIEVSERVSQRLLPERLQLLGATILYRSKLDSSKTVKDKKAANALLNTRFEEISLARLYPLAREMGIKEDILDPENVAELAKLLGLDAENDLGKVLREGIVHNVLNAKYHEREAEIIAEAGEEGAVTIATNMAGRGVDILLGGPEQSEIEADGRTPEARRVVELGGLHILGTERHEARRIDNQLRGRSGRQGDPGSSRFYVSFEDELMRLFGDKTNSPLLAGWQEDQAIDSKLLSRMIERAQKKVEEHNFAIRKHVLQYDDVMNLQRDTIYTQRRLVLEGREVKDTILGYLEATVQSSIASFCNRELPRAEWDFQALFDSLDQIFPLALYAVVDDLRQRSVDDMAEFLMAIVNRTYSDREQEIGPALMRDIERSFMLQVIDRKWMEHLDNMDILREGIGLRGYAQQEPIIAYQKEAFEMFQVMIDGIQEEVTRIIYRVQVAREPERRQTFQPTSFSGGDLLDQMRAANAAGATSAFGAKGGKLGRNDPCPCGSGKKYKNCCLGNKQATM